ncbi:MAG TPA: ATP-binding SpoIIE family protein phosphatase [Streptomyces sp.]|uniref:ATP-binding SpoIIE family protein phosphatase n=1 Tax=Streptomyces sp. TaxID=1931 RepID=UPI002CC671B8|nr:ATP-binding SpoIIE family protein phosphatase [Streptomyces sp.]HWU10150.1 ATP-binding SpoIIE family protein phosphatase [Streptomyces sp.]
MGSLSSAAVTAEDVVWLRDQQSFPASARVAAVSLARRIGFDEQRCAEVALAVSEAATNLGRHAVDGALLLRVVRTSQDAGIEFVTTDAGPGMADVAKSLTDGTSTAGTLGIGLGAISRLADAFDLHSIPGRGTVLAARFWMKEAARRTSGLGDPVVEGLTRTIAGEDVCGDAWAARPVGAPWDKPAPRTGSDVQRTAVPERQAPSAGTLSWAQLTGFRPNGADLRPQDTGRPMESTAGGEEALLVMFCDGLGHGPLAGRAAQAAVTAFHNSAAEQPEALLTAIHTALRGGRGGAVTVVRIEPRTRSVYFCGVGNVSTFVVDPGSGARRSLLSAPGIVGHHMPTLRTVRQDLPPEAAVIMHSDGLSERWRTTALPGFLDHSPLVAAAQLLREAGVRRDDAGVVVAKGAW